jgi:glycosyltransferase involved in cell wall biosynthesis
MTDNVTDATERPGETQRDTPYLSLVIPLLDEEESLRQLYEHIVAVVDREGYSAEIIFIDDGSRDGSWTIIRELCNTDDRVRGIRFRRNFGKSAGLRTGFRVARGEIVVTMDADLQDDPEEIPNLIAKLDEGYDLVTGWKEVRHDPISKRLPSKIFNRVTSMLTGLRLHDFNCGLKAYHREVTQELRMNRGMHRFVPALAHWRGFRVTEIPVKHHPRLYGKSKYGLKRFVEGFLDLLTVILLTRYSARPLHFFGWTGTALIVGGLAIEAYIAWIRLTTGWIQHRYPLLWLGVLMILVGLQLLTTGLLAELVASISQSREQQESIAEEINVEGADG